MKICPECTTRFHDPQWQCPHCGYRPPAVDGYLTHSAALAVASGSGFRPEEFELLAKLEEESFWFRGRNKLIVQTLHRYCSDARSLLEIGCGTGFVLQGIGREFPKLALYGSEVSVAGLGVAKRRSGAATFFQMDAGSIPYEEEFDVVGAFDVLEHIEDDQRVIAQIYRALAPGGRTIISVPQHMFLWSGQDRHARHFRRYSTHELQRKLEATGFRIELKTSFVTFLLPALYASRRIASRYDAGDGVAELRLPPLLNRPFGWTLSAEQWLIAHGVRFPVGGSQLVVARKSGKHGGGPHEH